MKGLMIGLLITLCQTLLLLSVGVERLNGAVVAVVDTPDTFGDADAWAITNYMPVKVSRAVFTFTPASFGNFDDNLPSQTSYGFTVNPLSDPTGVTASWADPSSAPADFHGWRSLVLNFTGFDTGERIIFQADTDGSIGTAPPIYGAARGDAFSGILQLTVTFDGGGTGNAIFSKSGLYASTASVVPEPSALVLLGIGALGLLAWAYAAARLRNHALTAVFGRSSEM